VRVSAPASSSSSATAPLPPCAHLGSSHDARGEVLYILKYRPITFKCEGNSTSLRTQAVAERVVGFRVEAGPERVVEACVERGEAGLDAFDLRRQVLVVAGAVFQPRVDDHQVREDLGLVVGQVAGAVEVEEAREL